MNRDAFLWGAAVAALCAFLCGCDSSYRVEVRVGEPDLFDHTVAVEVYILESCQGYEMATAPPESFEQMVVARVGESSPHVGALTPGAAALLALARNSECQVIGSGCTEVSMEAGGSGVLTVDVVARSGQGCALGLECAAGQCEPPGPCTLASASEQYCDAVPTLPRLPVLDGEVECGLPLRPLPLPLYLGAEGEPEPAPPDIRYALAYHPEGLYAFVEVFSERGEPADPVYGVYCGASVEIFVDADGQFATEGQADTPGTRQIVIAAPGQSPRGTIFWRDEQNETLESNFTLFHTTPTEEGYIVETLVRPVDLGLPAQTQMGPNAVGFAMSLNISALEGEPVWYTSCRTGEMPLGVRYGQFEAHPTQSTQGCDPGRPYCDTRAYCTPQVLP